MVPTVKEFIHELRTLALAQPRPVLAIDFEPSKDGLKLTARFKRTLDEK